MRERRTSPSPTRKPREGERVSVVQKADYGTDNRVVGTVARVLTRAAEHPRGFISARAQDCRRSSRTTAVRAVSELVPFLDEDEDSKEEEAETQMSQTGSQKAARGENRRKKRRKTALEGE